MQNNIPWISIWLLVCICLYINNHKRLFTIGASIFVVYLIVNVISRCNLISTYRVIDTIDLENLYRKWISIGAPESLQNNPDFVNLLHYIHFKLRESNKLDASFSNLVKSCDELESINMKFEVQSKDFNRDSAEYIKLQLNAKTAMQEKQVEILTHFGSFEYMKGYHQLRYRLKQLCQILIDNI